MGNLDLGWIAALDVEQACLGGCGRRVQGPVHCDSCFAKHARARAKPTWEAVRERIPARFRWATFGAGELSERVARPDAVREARDAAGRSVLLTGPSRSGKTSLAAAILVELLELGAHPKAKQTDVLRALGLRWTSALQLCAAKQQHAYGTGPAAELEIAIGSSVLVIDDLGQEIDPSACSEVIFTRHDAKRPTVVTTGLSRVELGTKYGAGIMERLCECAVIIAGIRQ